jgi:hypothetical protein
MAKFKTGDIVRSTGNSNCTYKVLEAGDDFCRIELHASFGEEAVGLERHLGPRGEGVSSRTLSLVEQPTAPFTLLDDEGRKALKAGDRVLVEAEVDVPYPDHSGELQFKVLKGGTRIGLCWAGAGAVFALLPPAEKPIAVGDFVNILGRTGSQGKVLAFMSNGHAVVEYVAGDDFNVSHYDVSCLKVIS